MSNTLLYNLWHAKPEPRSELQGPQGPCGQVVTAGFRVLGVCGLRCRVIWYIPGLQSSDMVYSIYDCMGRGKQELDQIVDEADVGLSPKLRCL